jgi:hypothetical protein
MRSYLNYCTKYFMLIGFVLFPFVMYSYSMGEYSSAREAADKQLMSTEKIIYGTALHDITHSYKKYMLSKVHPKIVALGSSRIMQLRDYMFSDSFYNLGGVMHSVKDGLDFSSAIINEAPEVVIINVDVWWFNDKVELPSNSKNSLTEDDFDVSPEITPADLVKVIKWVFAGDISIREIYSSLIFGRNLIGTRGIGIGGNRGSGFGPDGSHYYTRLITGKKASKDINFANTLERIHRGDQWFKYSISANNQHIDNFMNLVEKLTRNNIHVVAFFPPFAPKVNTLISELGEKYNYIRDLKQKLKNSGLKIFDFTDPSSIDSNSCEFVDGFHGGDIISMRILVEIVLNDSFFDKYVEKSYLTKLIKQYRGLAFRPDKTITKDEEVDFLNLGCDKQL